MDTKWEDISQADQQLDLNGNRSDGNLRISMHSTQNDGMGDKTDNHPDIKKPNRSLSTPLKPSGLYYDVQDNPPIHLAALFGFQIALSTIFSCVQMAVLLSEYICSDQQFTASLYATTSVTSGICTILQTSFGVRLPIFQGPSILFTIPYLNAATDPAWGCQRLSNNGNISLSANGTVEMERHQPWLPEWNKVNGGLMVASVFQILIGSLGLGGLLLRLMGPISITCLILLLGISIQGLIASIGEVHWGMSCLNIVIIIIMTQYLNKVMVPMPSWTRKKGFQFVPFPLFELFPILLSVIIGWIISYILTVCGVFPDDPSVLQYQARTDFAGDSIRDAPILYVPYPGQYGKPSFDLSYTLVLIVVVMGSILESVGDYVQATGPSRVPKPPAHAINRGIIMEGLGSLLSGSMGAGHATTSFSNIIGLIGVTKNASRLVFNMAGVFMILMGICGKLGATFVAIPKPVLTGSIFISISLLVGAALSNLRDVDLWSTRNQGVLGIAIMAGAVFPPWVQKNPDAFNTGSPDFDQVLVTLLGTPLVVGVILAMVLDITVPGSGRKRTSTSLEGNGDLLNPDIHPRISTDMSIYNPPFVTEWLAKFSVTRYIPFLPNPPKRRHTVILNSYPSETPSSPSSQPSENLSS